MLIFSSEIWCFQVNIDVSKMIAKFLGLFLCANYYRVSKLIVFLTYVSKLIITGLLGPSRTVLEGPETIYFSNRRLEIQSCKFTRLEMFFIAARLKQSLFETDLYKYSFNQSGPRNSCNQSERWTDFGFDKRSRSQRRTKSWRIYRISRRWSHL